MQMTSYRHGMPCWVDLMVADPAKAASFYGALFGWHVPPGSPDFGGYANADLGGRLVAGVMPKMAPDMPTVWSSYIAVDDARATLELAVQEGATVIAPATDVGSLGTMAVFADPQGAVIGIWQAGEHIGAHLVAEPGTLRWNELAARDFDAAKAFYPTVFGWEAAEFGGGAQYIMWNVGGQPVAGMMPMPATVPAEVPSYWLVYFEVTDCDQAASTVTALGGQVVLPPQDAPGVGRLSMVQDDQGAAFAVIAMEANFGANGGPA